MCEKCLQNAQSCSDQRQGVAASNPRCHLMSRFVYMRIYSIACSWQLYANMSSFIKPEVHNTTPPDEDRDTAICNIRRKLGRARTRVSRDILAEVRPDRDRRTRLE